MEAAHSRGPEFEPTQGVTKSGHDYWNEDNIWKHSRRFVETLEQVSEMKTHIVTLDLKLYILKHGKVYPSK